MGEKLALAASLTVALAFTACGGSGSDEPVARVGDAKITKAQFDHWLRVSALSQPSGDPDQAAGQGTDKIVEVPQPPDFRQCIAARQLLAAKQPQGQAKPTNAQLKAQCRLEYRQLRGQVLQFLISARWIQGEAAERGIEVSDAEVRRQYEQTKRRSFPKQTDFEKYLKASGMTLDDLLFRTRVTQLSAKVRAKAIAGKDEVTDAQIAAYYEQARASFSRPERRDLRIVLAQTKAKGDRALAGLRAGQPWARVARRYSVDAASNNQGGLMLDVTKGQRDPALDDAIFSAPKGKLVGPVKTEFGYYVLAVQKITKASQQTLAQATPSIRRLLGAQNRQKALQDFVKRFHDKWKSRTTCSRGYITQDCRNA